MSVSISISISIFIIIIKYQVPGINYRRQAYQVFRLLSRDYVRTLDCPRKNLHINRNRQAVHIILTYDATSAAVHIVYYTYADIKPNIPITTR